MQLLGGGSMEQRGRFVSIYGIKERSVLTNSIQ